MVILRDRDSDAGDRRGIVVTLLEKPTRTPPRSIIFFKRSILSLLLL